MDAAWENVLTGITISFHMPSIHNAVFIKATSNVAHSSLQAELVVLQLAMEVAKFLNFAGATFLMDNTTIADTVKDYNADQYHWSLRPLWSQIINVIPENLMQVVWIPRKIITDKLAKEAIDLNSILILSLAVKTYPSRDCQA